MNSPTRLQFVSRLWLTSGNVQSLPVNLQPMTTEAGEDETLRQNECGITTSPFPSRPITR